ncbi:hypothetical protein HQ39_05595 [Porphyromonas sp. COT-108 OH2963]|nr:hypothetical protein HQ39_05595 [Porphyromonas sp. COT-108 OH2963]
MQIFFRRYGKNLSFVRDFIFVPKKIYFCTYENIFLYVRKKIFVRTKFRLFARGAKNVCLCAHFQAVTALSPGCSRMRRKREKKCVSELRNFAPKRAQKKQVRSPELYLPKTALGMFRLFSAGDQPKSSK